MLYTHYTVARNLCHLVMNSDGRNILHQQNLYQTTNLFMKPSFHCCHSISV